MSSMSSDDSYSDSYTEQGQQMLSDVKDKAKQSLEHVTSFVKTRSKTFWMVLGVALVVLLGSLIYEWWRVSALWKRYINCPGCYARFHNKIADCSDKRPVRHNRLTKPQSGYTYSMWLYVVDWYSGSFGKWKSVYYRGVQLDRSNSNCGVTWDSISKQQPGVWLSDTQNNLRVVVTTSVNLPAKCVDESPGADKTNTETTYGQCHGTSMNIEMKNMYLLEYAELTDFPIGEWFQLTFVVTQKRLELYKNGQLVNTTVFVGEYRNLCNSEDGHFASTGDTFRGRVLNFRYMPHALPYQMVRRLYEYEAKNKLLKLHDPMDELSERQR